ncbi:SusC/RagA family TonB-linked outer membrane protein [Draconibacterium orientale]|uniref:SusC/RagA family TonB-linked outer membrane protein n=1 Tax=Draconibacterium orientale TaxID=1168034 RepID=UPI002ABD3D85|nr:SusC/RagA family TonB-linked outer membrane protein [Draconibacterium orientale]
MKKIALMLLGIALFGVLVAEAQVKSITGTVISSDDDMGIPGVSVSVKGTTIGTVTNLDGVYQLEVPSDATTLIFSFVGMKTQEVEISGSVINAVMEADLVGIDEVMVVAYGTTKRSQFVGSAKAVTGEELATKSTSNISNALQGAAAGVQVVNGSGQPGTGATIRIRGVGSINGGTSPLYIVDGSPYEFNLNTINPSDIESITVLKDASSTAIYGARGANGVILITTKNGSKDGNIIVNVDAKWGHSSRGVPTYDVMTDPAMYYETAYKALYNSQAYNGVSAADAYAYADVNFLTQSGVGYQIYSYPEGERLIGTNFKLNPNATLGYADDDFYYTPDNWEDETLATGNMRQEYNISVRGGQNESQYFISAGYLDDPGIINGSGFTRYTLRGKIDSQAKDWLAVGLSASYVNTELESPGSQGSWGSTGNVFYTSNMMAPIYPFYVRNTDGTIAQDNNGNNIYDQGTSTNFTRPGSAPRGNNAINLLLDTDKEVRDLFAGSFYAKLTPFEGFNITARISPEASNTRSNYLSNPFYGSISTEGLVSVSQRRVFTFNQQYLANYKKAITESQNIEVLAGFESFTLKDQYLGASNDHLYDPYIPELDNAFGTQPTSANASSYTDNYATQGFVGRVQYDFQERFFFNASMRYEGSSRFSADNRWGVFGSVGAAWLVTKETFMQSTANWLKELKYKVSYGTQGNDQIGSYYAYRNRYDISYNSVTGEYTKVLKESGNPDLTWEAQKLFNTGVEFGLVKNVLNGSIDYFYRENSDMLFNEPQPVSSGLSTIPKNIGSVVNQGFEVDLNSEILKTNQLTWTVFANITHINSEIKELPEYTEATGGIKRSSYILKEGGSLNQAYLVEYAGVDTETGMSLYYVDPDNDDYSTTTDYSAAEQADLGDISVKWYGGFGTNLNAYGFDLGVQFAYQLGGKAYDGSYQELMHTGKEIGRNWHTDILDAWTPTNTNTNVPRISSSDDFDQKNSSRFLTSSNYLSLNNITLGYTFPTSLTRKMNIQKLRLYVSADNLALFSSRKGFDPRQSQNARATGVALSTSSGNYVYSQLRVVSGGVSISF